MFYVYPAGTTATVIADYERPRPDPIAVGAGAKVVPDEALTAETDIPGWTPTAWVLRSADGCWRMSRDLSALEHTVRQGDSAALHYAGSGFVWASVNGAAAWIPDAVLRLDARCA